MLGQNLRRDGRIVPADHDDVRVELAHGRSERRARGRLHERDTSLVLEFMLNELARHRVQVGEQDSGALLFRDGQAMIERRPGSGNGPSDPDWIQAGIRFRLV